MSANFGVVARLPAACALVFEAAVSRGGYTEPLLHKFPTGVESRILTKVRPRCLGWRGHTVRFALRVSHPLCAASPLDSADSRDSRLIPLVSRLIPA